MRRRNVLLNHELDLDRVSRLLPALALVALAAACAPSVRTPVTSPTPPRTEVPASAAGRVVDTALSLQGTPYRNGGTDPRTGLDCSGLVQFVYRQAAGVPLPREVRGQFGVGRAIGRDEIRAGDLVFFTTVSPGASHVGIALDADRFVHAPSSRGVVRVERLDTTYWRSRFIGARRLR